MQLKDKIKNFPRSPGVYLFKDANGKVLYVGKAKDLKKRIKNYFAKGRDNRPSVEFLIKRTRDIDFVVTDTEKEALFLENTLIKEHKPRYNIELKDDKSYISIRIGTDKEYPSIMLTRKVRKDGATYFGPYNSSLGAKEAIDLITRSFRLRSCRDGEFANRIRPCLKFDIGRCTAPCVGKVSLAEYAEQVNEACLFLSGKRNDLIRSIEEKMARASEDMNYEEAARLRDVVHMLKGLLEKQGVVRHGGGDLDAIGVYMQGQRAAVCVLSIRDGLLNAKKSFYFVETIGNSSKVIEDVLLQYYSDETKIPRQILLSTAPEALNEIRTIISERAGRDVKLKIPVRGDQLHLITLANKNAEEELLKKSNDQSIIDTLQGLKNTLALKKLPQRIECVDISNTEGREAIGSIVTFVDGEPVKSEYRIYNVRTIDTPDDYAMMMEVLGRRFDVRGDRPDPDLLLVDGGKGQLAVAKRVISQIGMDIDVAAIAKYKKEGDGVSKPDEIYIPNRKNPIIFKRGNREILLLMRIRDEAHRFGINAHRRRRSKKMLGDI